MAGIGGSPGGRHMRERRGSHVFSRRRNDSRSREAGRRRQFLRRRRRLLRRAHRRDHAHLSQRRRQSRSTGGDLADELGDSRRIRGGSRFHIRLPPRRQSAHARGAGSRLRRLQLFDIRRSLRRTLREASPKPVVAAPSGPVPPAAPARRRPLTSSRRPTQRPLPGSLERRAHRADFPQRTALRTR